jgi:hypothetical protein
MDLEKSVPLIKRIEGEQQIGLKMRV